MPYPAIKMAELTKDLKITGYVLLIVGICLMVFSVVAALSVFTGSGNVPIEILKADETSDTSQGTSGENGEPNIDMGQLMTPMFPVFNLMVFLAIAFFILLAGQKLARLGLNILKPTPAPIIKTAVIKKEPAHPPNKKF